MSSLQSSLGAARWRARLAGQNLDSSELPFLRSCLGFHEDDDGGPPLGKVAAWAIGLFGAHQLLDIYHEVVGLSGPDAPEVADLVYAMGKVPMTQESLELLQHLALTGPIEDTALWACLALADVGDSAVPFLHEGIARNDMSPHRRLLFADALARIPSIQAQEAYQNSLSRLTPEEGEAIYRFLDSIRSAKTGLFL